MPRKPVVPVRTAADALTVLGDQIRLGRHDRHWTAAQLAKRLGVHPNTVTAIEAGNPGTAIGTVFNAAVLVGVSLFGADRVELARLRRQGREQVALLPSREQPHRSTNDTDDFDF